MRALKIAVVVMGVLIVLGTMGLVVVIARRSAAPMVAVAPPPASTSAVLNEPDGTRIAGIAAAHDRLAIQLQGGGTDRVVLIDTATGTVAGRILLAQ
ncbi:MAG TPA: hypothetical protein VGM32_09085 [Rhodopila sp.]